MISDSGIIVVSLITTVGMLALMFLSQYNYKNKKTFDFNLKQEGKINNIKMAELRKEMGLKKTAVQQPDQNLDLNSIVSNIAKNYNNDDDEEGEPDLMDVIVNIAKDNPEIVQKFIGNVAKGKVNQAQETILGG